jgi:vacuolar protein sorting-associated protein 45
LGDTLDLLIKARLKDTDYPFVDTQQQQHQQQVRERPQDIIVFMCGGTTFEEARYIAQLNASTPGIRIVLGGNCVHNSKTFLQQVQQVGEGYMNLSSSNR